MSGGSQKTALVSQRERAHASLTPDEQPKQSPYTVIPWQYYALLNNEPLEGSDLTLATQVYKGLHGVDYVSQTEATFVSKEEQHVAPKLYVKKVVPVTANKENTLFDIAKLSVSKLNNTEKGAIFGILCRDLGYELE